MIFDIQYLVVFIASVVSMGVGFLWYSPIIVGKQWMRERNFTEDSLKKAQAKMGPLYGVSFVVSLITAYALAQVIGMSQSMYEQSTLQIGITSATWMWFGFIMPVQVTQTIFSDEKNWKLFAIDSGYQLASVLAMGTVLGILS